MLIIERIIGPAHSCYSHTAVGNQLWRVQHCLSHVHSGCEADTEIDNVSAKNAAYK